MCFVVDTLFACCPTPTTRNQQVCYHVSKAVCALVLALICASLVVWLACRGMGGPLGSEQFVYIALSAFGMAAFIVKTFVESRCAYKASSIPPAERA